MFSTRTARVFALGVAAVQNSNDPDVRRKRAEMEKVLPPYSNEVSVKLALHFASALELLHPRLPVLYDSTVRVADHTSVAFCSSAMRGSGSTVVTFGMIAPARSEGWLASSPRRALTL